MAPGEACTLPPREKPPIDRALPDPAFLAALRIRGQMMLRLPIAPQGIADLVALNWLDWRKCSYQPSVPDAALNARLRPRWS
jgi:hypothetical protein